MRTRLPLLKRYLIFSTEFLCVALSWILAARPAQRSSRQDEFRYAHSCQNPLSWIIGGSQALYSVTILQKQNLHSISLFTGTCLGGFAAVALAKIRKKKRSNDR